MLKGTQLRHQEVPDTGTREHYLCLWIIAVSIITLDLTQVSTKTFSSILSQPHGSRLRTCRTLHWPLSSSHIAYLHVHYMYFTCINAGLFLWNPLITQGKARTIRHFILGVLVSESGLCLRSLDNDRPWGSVFSSDALFLRIIYGTLISLFKNASLI